MHLSDGQPVVFGVANESLLESVVLDAVLNFSFRQRHARDVIKLQQSTLDHLNAEISVVCNVVAGHALTKPFGVHVVSKKFTFFLIKSNCNLGKLDLIEVRPLEQGINAVDSAHHVRPLLFKVDNLLSLHICEYNWLIGNIRLELFCIFKYV